MADEFTKAALYGIKTFNEKVKEKIGMQKLIELLNEYEQEEGCWRLKYGKLHNKYYDDYDRKDEEIRLISKWYGFIKWLVENEKIDHKKIADETYVKVNGEWYELILGCHYDLYQQTLMLLSIQDEPILFLISILKDG